MRTTTPFLLGLTCFESHVLRPVATHPVRGKTQGQ